MIPDVVHMRTSSRWAHEAGRSLSLTDIMVSGRGEDTACTIQQ